MSWIDWWVNKIASSILADVEAKKAEKATKARIEQLREHFTHGISKDYPHVWKPVYRFVTVSYFTDVCGTWHSQRWMLVAHRCTKCGVEK